MVDRNEDGRARLGALEVMRKAGQLEKWAYRIEDLLESPAVLEWLGLEDIGNLRMTMGGLMRIEERVREVCAVEMISKAGIRREALSK